MQHRSILTNHLIITTTFNKPFFKDCLFPAGNLREFRIGRKRGNTILVTKCPKYLSSEDRVRFSDSLKLFSNQKAYFTTISYSETIINSIKKINTIILDPPRNGISKQVINQMIEKKPHTIVYVSCNPSTLARDTKILLNNKYELTNVVGLDLFPMTHHVECVTSFSKK